MIVQTLVTTASHSRRRRDRTDASLKYQSQTGRAGGTVSSSTQDEPRAKKKNKDYILEDNIEL